MLLMKVRASSAGVSGIAHQVSKLEELSNTTCLTTLPLVEGNFIRHHVWSLASNVQT